MMKKIVVCMVLSTFLLGSCATGQMSGESKRRSGGKDESTGRSSERQIERSYQ